MTPLTPRNIVNHELIGLDVKVWRSSCPSYRRLEGKVMDESRNMLVIETSEGLKKVPKKGSTFRFKTEEGLAVLVEGWAIHGRPEERVVR